MLSSHILYSRMILELYWDSRNLSKYSEKDKNWITGIIILQRVMTNEIVSCSF